MDRGVSQIDKIQNADQRQDRTQRTSYDQKHVYHIFKFLQIHFSGFKIQLLICHITILFYICLICLKILLLHIDHELQSALRLWHNLQIFRSGYCYIDVHSMAVHWSHDIWHISDSNDLIFLCAAIRQLNRYFLSYLIQRQIRIVAVTIQHRRYNGIIAGAKSIPVDLIRFQFQCMEDQLIHTIQMRADLFPVVNTRIPPLFFIRALHIPVSMFLIYFFHPFPCIAFQLLLRFRHIDCTGFCNTIHCSECFHILCRYSLQIFVNSTEII